MATPGQKIFTDWQALMQLTQGKPFVVERVRITGSKLFLQGCFALPQFARLNSENQRFITDLARCYGSIEEMERSIGYSHATIRSQLSQIAGSVPILCCAWWRPDGTDLLSDPSPTSPA